MQKHNEASDHSLALMIAQRGVANSESNLDTAECKNLAGCGETKAFASFGVPKFKSEPLDGDTE